jgi:Polyphosphate kinase 2 (PPK2)
MGKKRDKQKQHEADAQARPAGARQEEEAGPPWAPWYVAHTDDKKRGRLNIVSHLLSQVPASRLPTGTSRCPRGSAPAATSSRTCHCGPSRRRSRQPSEKGDNRLLSRSLATSLSRKPPAPAHSAP